ncbi:MAG: dihydroorotate dehydrogenase electron transfer subunit [Candidatus Omnitrophota bacterium]
MNMVLMAKIIANNKIIDNFYKMQIDAPEIAKVALPGQFLNIKINYIYKPLLRKPLGIHNVSDNKKSIEILYKVVGEGTKILSEKQKGQYVDVLGPLGNGFEHSILDARCSILVAGGIGVAPLLFLAKKLVHNPKPLPCRPAGTAQSQIVLIGTKTKRHILCEEEFKDFGYEVKVATDDGSKGFKGTVADLLLNKLQTTNYPSTSSGSRAKSRDKLQTIYACGPKPMLKRVAEISKKNKISCFGLLEEYMACGTGACFGCAVLTKAGYKRVCKDGPVFDLSVIEW